MRRQRMRRKDFVREASKTFPVARERMHLLREPQPDSNSLFVAGTKHPVSEVLYGEFEYLQDFEYLDRATQDRGSAILAVFGRERSEKENLACHDKLKNLLCERGLRYHEVYGMYQQVPCDAEAHDFDSGLVHEDLLLCHVPCNPDSVSDFESFSAWMLEIVTHKLETAALLLVAPYTRSAMYREHETSINFDMARCDVQASLELFIKSRMQGPEETAIVSRWAIRKPASANDALLMQKKGIL